MKHPSHILSPNISQKLDVCMNVFRAGEGQVLHLSHALYCSSSSAAPAIHHELQKVLQQLDPDGHAATATSDTTSDSDGGDSSSSSSKLPSWLLHSTRWGEYFFKYRVFLHFCCAALGSSCSMAEWDFLIGKHRLPCMHYPLDHFWSPVKHQPLCNTLLCDSLQTPTPMQ